MSQARKIRRHLRGVHAGNDQKSARNTLLEMCKRDIGVGAQDFRSEAGEGKFFAARKELLKSLQVNKRIDMGLVRAAGYV